MKAQPPFAEGQRLFNDIEAPHDSEESPPAPHAISDEARDSDARSARNVMIWTFSAFVAFWVMLFAAYMLVR